MHIIDVSINFTNRDDRRELTSGSAEGKSLEIYSRGEVSADPRLEVIPGGMAKADA